MLKSHWKYLQLLLAEAADRADRGSALLSVFAAVCALVGVAGIANAFGGWLPGGGAWGALLAPAVFLLGHRLWVRDQAAIERYECGQPLVVTDVWSNGDWRGLTICNPNSFVVRQCFVEITSYEANVTGNDRLLPPIGFRFGWSTWQVQKPTLLFDIAPGADGKVDLHQLLPKQGLFTHVFPGDGNNTYLPTFGLPEGAYQFSIRVGASGADIPTSVWAVETRYDVNGLTVNCQPATRARTAPEVLAPSV